VTSLESASSLGVERAAVRQARSTWRPGRIYLITLAFALVAYAYLKALPGWSFLLIPLAYVGVVLGLIWLVSLVRAVYIGGLNPLARFSRWAGIALVVGAVGLAGLSGLFIRIGFDISRAGLEAAAANASATGWAGIYPVWYVSPSGRGSTVWIGFPAGLFDDVGFYRSTTGDGSGACEEEGGYVARLDSHWFEVSCNW
jgi:hypothetical protein